ncbi:epimerase [Niabella ginsenosidivorans]|uniref:Epimerase n=1 Tax=Niabella ginsenosidivorans TaxID=1176587 RepID=A0A1A9HZ48_9BACT|nr:NAD-dependent epimerase/dehydratase family protein [Niabella ginsenosidivorans]ANH80678.1 epimerase [Niabella ginsenosidivorans]
MAKVLITGATGLLGYNTALEFCRQGSDVRVLVRSNTELAVLKSLFCEIYYGSIENGDDVSTAVTGCDYVIHAASLTAQWGIDKEQYETVNIKGTENVIRACLNNNIKKLVYISTANTIAPGSIQNPGTELNSFTLFKVNSPYINTKYIAQQKVLEAVVEKQLPAVVLNPTFMIGPFDFKPSSGRIFKFASGAVVFYPPGGKNFVYVKDVSKAIMAACTAPVSGECLLVAGENMSYRHFFKMTNMIRKQKSLMIRIPAFLLKAAGFMGTVLGWMLNKRLKLNYSSAKLLCMDNYYSGTKAKDQLGIAYTPVAKAVTDALAWFETENKID